MPHGIFCTQDKQKVGGVEKKKKKKKKEKKKEKSQYVALRYRKGWGVNMSISRPMFLLEGTVS